MNTALEPLEHAPESESLAAGPCCPLLPHESVEGMDDMLDFTAKAKTLLADEFAAHGWGNTAAGELADIEIESVKRMQEQMA